MWTQDDATNTIADFAPDGTTAPTRTSTAAAPYPVWPERMRPQAELYPRERANSK
jgi:hypothetical protein